MMYELRIAFYFSLSSCCQGVHCPVGICFEICAVHTEHLSPDRERRYYISHNKTPPGGFKPLNVATVLAPAFRFFRAVVPP
ncbi:hypothetical protein BDW42DRAFT_148049 [Aspergillus taichungensis]|uniref:Uncharacterized protein n=1 Tax=Aspergillus taichungensis TaxID=482145 RepID=A0A2J5HLQ2_9EURO|nr:hypothetical protein BDW42DRAFT_148049 [Aspergillus taichungensis]